MATPTQITALRRLIGELDDEEPWSDAVIADLIDTAPNGSTNWAAWQAWEQKASLAADLVDTSESGSSRKNSSLYDNAIKQAMRYRDMFEAETDDPSDTDLTGTTYSLPIERV